MARRGWYNSRADWRGLQPPQSERGALQDSSLALSLQKPTVQGTDAGNVIIITSCSCQGVGASAHKLELKAATHPTPGWACQIQAGGDIRMRGIARG